MDHALTDAQHAEKLTAARERYDRIRKRIEPFVVQPRAEPPAKIGTWRRGIDLPDDSNERYRFEFYGP